MIKLFNMIQTFTRKRLFKLFFNSQLISDEATIHWKRYFQSASIFWGASVVFNVVAFSVKVGMVWLGLVRLG